MKAVVYVGQATIRELTAANIATMGVEQKKDFSFRRGEPQEVTNAVADLLVRSGEFDAYEGAVGPVPDPEDQDEAVDPGAGPAPDESSGDEGTASETPQEHADA